MNLPGFEKLSKLTVYTPLSQFVIHKRFFLVCLKISGGVLQYQGEQCQLSEFFLSQIKITNNLLYHMLMPGVCSDMVCGQ